MSRRAAIPYPVISEYEEATQFEHYILPGFNYACVKVLNLKYLRMQNSYKVGVQNSFSLLLDEGAGAISKAKGEKPDKKCKPRKSAKKSKTAIAKNADPLGETEKPVPPEPPKEDKSANPAAIVITAAGKSKKKKKKRPTFIPPKKTTIDIPDEKMVTLTDYMERHCTIRKKPDYNLRQAGEGEDPTQWKNLVPLKKKKNNPEDEMPPIPQRVIQRPPTPEPKMQRSPVPRKRHLNIPVRFGEPSVHKCQYHHCTLHNEPHKDTQIPPKVDDDEDFPCLGN